MEEWVASAISAASGILGAGVGGTATYLSQRASGKSQHRAELAAAVISYGYALDAMHLQIQRLPRSTMLGRASVKAINPDRTPNLNRLVEWGFNKTIGRDGERAIDRLLAATNRLLLVAPEPLLDPLEQINALLGDVEQRDEGWDERWSGARGEFLKTARSLVR